MQERCNELIKENFYLKQELDKYKSQHTFKKSNIKNRPQALLHKTHNVRIKKKVFNAS